MKSGKVLFIGESWHVHTVESKGFDVFSFDYYEEATEYIKSALEKNGWEFCHIPSHLVEQKFPKTLYQLMEYDAVMLSDVGANTMNLPMNVFLRLQTEVDKLELIKEYVESGKAFVMIGGYLSFQGIQGRGCYKNTPVEDILPVELLPFDDRVEKCQGIIPEVIKPEHEIMKSVPGDWPKLLGYNKLIPKENAEVVVKLNDDPMIILGNYGKGRVCAYATDCAPHWSPVEFCKWEGYSILWGNIMKWLTNN